MLLMLERAGQITLPPVSYVRHNPLSKRARPEPVQIDTTPIDSRLRSLQPLKFEQVRRTLKEPLFNSLMEEHHYLGYEQPVGEHLKFLVWAEPPQRRSGRRGTLQGRGIAEDPGCPECGKGNVYGQKEPKVLVRIIGQAPLHPITPTPGVTGTPDERLRLHQERSRPAMDRLHAWLEAQLDERRTEPNSGLGQAISYLLRHWQPLTLFLRKAGAPLDNNVVERALKRAVLHRKNALFYRTLNGAQVGDLFMSLIHTCQLCGANSFDYLVELQRHARELAARPTEWMPWNYRQTLARTMPLPDPA
jgi:predicted  nucleic acid-binding Zn-ribbon protein